MRVIKRLPDNPGFLFYLKRIVKRIIGKSPTIDAREMLDFQQNYMSFTDAISNVEQYELIDFLSFDILIVGSDQVWRFDYTKDRKFEYFFDFIKDDIQKIRFLSFAASFGVDDWSLSEQETEKIIKLLSRFDTITVREDSGVQICQDILKCKASSVLDPTFLLPVDEYRKLYKGNEPNNKGKIISYLLDENPEYTYFIEQIRSALRKTVITNGKVTTDVLGIWPYHKYVSISAWIKAFDDADFVITDSFHGVCFSIIFNTPFLVYANKKRGVARFKSILRYFELEGCLISSISDYSFSKLNQTYNWDKINSVIKQANMINILNKLC